MNTKLWKLAKKNRDQFCDFTLKRVSKICAPRILWKHFETKLMIYCKKDSSLFIRYYFPLKKDIFLGSRTTFNWFFIGCSDIQKIWTWQNFDQQKGIWIFTVDFVKNSHFFGSGMTCEVLFVLLVSRVILLCLLKKTNKTQSQVIPDPKKWPFFTKSAITKSNSYFFTKILTCPNFLDVRASTNVKRGQNSNLNLIKIRSEHE